MRIFALDIGDSWCGVALARADDLFAQPYQTVPATELDAFLEKAVPENRVTTVVVGYPKTMRGTKSEQTIKIEQAHAHLQHTFPHLTWVLWDERLSSKRAAELKQQKNKEDKIKSHAIAAAFILSSYLEYLRFQRESENSY